MRQRLGPGHRPPRRPADADPRRAGQRPGPRGHPVDPPAPDLPGRSGPVRLRLQPPAVRDGADGRPPRRHRAGPAHRRLLGAATSWPATPAPGSGSAAPAWRRSARRSSARAPRSPTTGRTRPTSSASPPPPSASWRHACGIPLHELAPQSSSLEEAFLEGTKAAQQFRAGSPPGAAPLDPPAPGTPGSPREERHPLRVDQAAHRSLEPRAARPLRRRPGRVHDPHHGHRAEQRRRAQDRFSLLLAGAWSATS